MGKKQRFKALNFKNFPDLARGYIAGALINKNPLPPAMRRRIEVELTLAAPEELAVTLATDILNHVEKEEKEPKPGVTG